MGDAWRRLFKQSFMDAFCVASGSEYARVGTSLRISEAWFCLSDPVVAAMQFEDFPMSSKICLAGSRGQLQTMTVTEPGSCRG